VGSADVEQGQLAVLELFETAEVVAITLDREGRLTYCNRYFSELVGRRRDELVGQDYFATCEPYRGPGAMEELLAAVERGGPSSFNETEVHTRRKGVRIVAWSDTPIRDATGEVVGTTSIGQDVTARRRAQMRFDLHLDIAHALAAARTIEEAGRDVLAAVASAVFLRSGTFWLVADDRLRAMAVHPPARPGTTVELPPGPARGEGAVGRAWERGVSVWEGGDRMAIPAVWDGEVIAVLEVQEVDGISQHEDVRRSALGMGNQIAQFLHRHRGDARRRAILNAAFDCIVLLDPTDAVAELNPATERTFGRAREELIGLPLAELVPGAAAAGEALDRHVHATGVRGDGSPFPVEYVVATIDLEDEAAHVVYLRDVTERVRAEAELAASRVRIVQTADHERRRLERNLHDGAQQRLVGIALALRLVEDRVASDPETAATLLARAREELAEALDELRELARGIHPVVLSDRGLSAALPGLAARCPVETTVEADVDRLDEAVEVAAYYTVSEALTNVAKYARASRAHVTATELDGWLEVVVADDGVGGADPAGGSGLQGLLDRVGALGGTLAISSPPGGGTRLELRLPVAQ
jgi:PAS domain S-box-containing protein